jgi:hypothetical protein
MATRPRLAHPQESRTEPAAPPANLGRSPSIEPEKYRPCGSTTSVTTPSSALIMDTHSFVGQLAGHPKPNLIQIRVNLLGWCRVKGLWGPDALRPGFETAAG